ncbi:MAG: hypothetical protein WCO08_01600 [Actinomycetes bacterium]
MASLNTLMDESSAQEIAMEMVLKRSLISKGSLYHHFEDYPDLVEQTTVARNRLFMNEDLFQISDAISGGLDLAQAKIALFDALGKRQSLYHTDDRAQRIWLISSALGNPRLRALLTQENLITSDLWGGIFNVCVARGWANQFLDSQSVAQLMDSLIFGRVIGEIEGESFRISEWLKIVEKVANDLFFEFLDA